MMETSIPRALTSEGAAISKHEIGVLFVHGIGQQRRGETLLSLGEPLSDWIRQWVEGAAAVPGDAAGSAEDGPVEPAGGEVSFDTVLFEPSPDQAPAHAVLRIEQSEAGHGRSTSWLLAEAFWADSFPDPSFPQVASWTMSVSPWVFASFIGRQLRLVLTSAGGHPVGVIRLVGKVLKVSWLLFLGVVGIPLIILLESILLLLMLTWLVPIPAVRQYLQWVYEKFAAMIGDSYIFTSSAMRQHAVTDCIRRHMDWLEVRCEKMVIVAHSQGAAATYLTLGRRPPRNLRVLVTYGSGILKLSQLATEKTSDTINYHRMLFYFPLLCLYSILFFYILRPPEAQGSLMPFYAFYSALALLVALLALYVSSLEDTSALVEWAWYLEGEGIHWVDVYATNDPVPNGPLLPSGPSHGLRLPESVEVRNRNSLLMDHTTYSENVDEFVSLLVATISRHAGSSIRLHHLTDLDLATLAAAPGRRRAVLSARRWDNWALGLSAVVLLANGPLLARLGAQATRLFASFKSLALVPRAGGPEGQDYSPALAGALVIAAGFLVLRKILDALWAWRGDLTAETLFTRGSRRLPGIAPLIVIFIDSVITTFGALGLAWAFSSHWRAPLRLFMALRPSDSPASAFHRQFLIIWFTLMFVLLFLKWRVVRAAIINPRFPRRGK